MNSAAENVRGRGLPEGHPADRIPTGGGLNSISAARSLATPSPWLRRTFSAYSRWYVSRHFHSVRISRTGFPPHVHGLPLVLYVNHASWWDPLVCLLLQNHFFNSHRAFAPMDARALQKYRFFGRLGFFPVEQDNVRGALQFLRTAGVLLTDSHAALWITPQGRFADIRERPVRFRPGLGHLPRHVERAAFIPVALEYVHWEERTPEVVCRFGSMDVAGTKSGRLRAGDSEWTRHFEQELAATQDALAAEVQRRCAADFECILTGKSGVGMAYDTWRACRAAFRGARFQRKHGSL
jgi:1-acyl-sn-glycerol-3-phosphate acyltransferase